MPMTTVLFAGRPEQWDDYREALEAAFAEAGIGGVRLTRAAAPEVVDYMIYAPNGPVQDFKGFSRLKAVFSLWAGVENVVGRVPEDVPLARMVDPGLTQGMVDYVCGHVLFHHLRIDRTLAEQDGIWRNATRVPPLSAERCVAMLGLGALGLAAARALQAIGFAVEGWARRPRQLDGLPTHSGRAGLLALLGRADFVVTLLPLTAQTRGILGAQAFDALKPGAVIINPGRGPLIDEGALLAALDAGKVRAATLDVFDTEPLPPAHPFWSHPRVIVTPH
ncbi:MAG: glyoxylate/hydroxypyruvate reductase A, partial [Alphaproteobacteria bacterium]